MIIACKSCKTRFVVSPAALGDNGRNVRCAKCKHTWFQSPPEEDLDEDIIDPAAGAPQEPRPIPPRSSLPVPQVKKSAPGALVAFAILLMLVAIGGGVVTFEKPLRTIGLAGLYDAIGWTKSNGLALADLDIQVLPGRSKARIFVKGMIINNGDTQRTIPMLRLLLTDKESRLLMMTRLNREGKIMEDASGHKVQVQVMDMPGNGLTLEPGESVPFGTQFEGSAKYAQGIHMDLGNSKDLWLQN